MLKPFLVSLLFHRRSDPARGELGELRKVICRLKASQPKTRFAVGAGVHLANNDFLSRFSGIESFRRTPVDEQKRYCSELSDLELGLRGQDPEMALGVGLYRLWLTEVLADRRKVAEILGEELTELSRRAGTD